MKKLILLLSIVFAGFLVTNANNYCISYKSDQQQKKKVSKIKKDGTPDMRFKDNKKAKRPLKKDGTPDKRYKMNKAVSSK